MVLSAISKLSGVNNIRVSISKTIFLSVCKCSMSTLTILLKTLILNIFQTISRSFITRIKILTDTDFVAKYFDS